MSPDPELNKQDQKALDRMVETDIDFATEQARVHEIVKDDESDEADA